MSSYVMLDDKTFKKRYKKVKSIFTLGQLERESEFISLKLGYNKYWYEIKKFKQEREKLIDNWSHRYNSYANVNAMERLEYCENVIKIIHNHYIKLGGK